MERKRRSKVMMRIHAEDMGIKDLNCSCTEGEI